MAVIGSNSASAGTGRYEVVFRMLISSTRLLQWVFLILCMAQAYAGDAKTTSSLGQFPAETPAEKELERMLANPDDKIDLASANYLIIADLPPFSDLTREAYYFLLDSAYVQFWNTHCAGPAGKLPYFRGPLGGSPVGLR